MTIDELLDMLSAPAQRALRPLKLGAIEDLCSYSLREIKDLHGIGPKAVEIIEREMKKMKLHFRLAEKPPVQKGADTEAIDDYIRSFPAATQTVLKKMRAIIRSAAPEATEKLSYRMPTFYLGGNLVYFAGFDHHVGLYPLPHALDAFRAELKGYKTGKGSIQFPLNEPLPEDLIYRIVKQRVQDNLAESAKPKTKPKRS